MCTQDTDENPHRHPRVVRTHRVRHFPRYTARHAPATPALHDTRQPPLHGTARASHHFEPRSNRAPDVTLSPQSSKCRIPDPHNHRRKSAIFSAAADISLRTSVTVHRFPALLHSITHKPALQTCLHS
jgi:hypothetical protein